MGLSYGSAFGNVAQILDETFEPRREGSPPLLATRKQSSKNRNVKITATVQIKMDLWTKSSGLAQQKRKRPNHLFKNLIAEYPAVQKHLQLDEAIRQRAGKSGFIESGAVELVKQYRQSKRV